MFAAVTSVNPLTTLSFWIILSDLIHKVSGKITIQNLEDEGPPKSNAGPEKQRAALFTDDDNENELSDVQEVCK